MSTKKVGAEMVIKETESLAAGLFALPSFTTGAARALDMGCTFDAYNESDNSATADNKALSADWRQVGAELSKAMVAHEYGE